MPGRRRPATNLVALAVLALALFWGLSGALPALAGALSAAPAHTASPRAAPAPTATQAAPGHVSLAPATPARSPRLELRLDGMTPRVVTATGPPTVTLTGQLHNGSDQVMRDVGIRVQRGDRLRTEGDVRTALSGDATNDAVTPAFTPVTDELAPGAAAPVRLTVPMRGTDTGSLQLQRSGVYELLVNVNGTPEGGDQVRLAGVRMLLPVLGVPPAAGQAAQPASADSAGRPTPVSMLYPLADQPRRLPTGPGEGVLLGDDQLAASLSPGGRLDGLLAALESGAPAGSPVRDAVCLAVDPDLLRTVRDMSTGYRVRGPDGREADGRGVAVASQWLDRLRVQAAGRCVVALPFADADLVALSRAGLVDLTRYATVDGARIASEILRTPVRAGITWPADGLLDERSLGDFARDGGKEVVLSADAVAMSGRSARGTTGGLARLAAPGTEALGVLADPLVTLAAQGEGAPTGTGLAGDVGPDATSRNLGSLLDTTAVSPAGNGEPLSAQDAIGAIVFRAQAGPNTSSIGSSGTSGGPVPLLVAPPHRWNTTGADAGELLGALGTLIAAGRLTPTALPDYSAVAAQPTPSRSTTDPTARRPGAASASPSPATGSGSWPVANASLVYPMRAGAREVPGTVTGRLRTDRDAAADLRDAAEPEPGVGFTPAQVFDPVTEGMLRAGSAVWRGSPDLAATATKVITERVALLRSLVRVLEPPSPYALGDREAPLPITLANGLPVAMRVRVALSDTPGLRTEAIGEQRIPPMGRLQLRVNAQLTRSGQFSVEARLTTVSGTPLGVPSRLLLRSTAYGTITLWLTGTAGLLLVILAVRRIARRLRGAASSRRGEVMPSVPATSAQPTPTSAAPDRVAASRAPPTTEPTPTRTRRTPATVGGASTTSGASTTTGQARTARSRTPGRVATSTTSPTESPAATGGGPVPPTPTGRTADRPDQRPGRRNEPVGPAGRPDIPPAQPVPPPATMPPGTPVPPGPPLPQGRARPPGAALPPGWLGRHPTPTTPTARPNGALPPGAPPTHPEAPQRHPVDPAVQVNRTTPIHPAERTPPSHPNRTDGVNGTEAGSRKPRVPRTNPGTPPR
jgi:hypothetical protein